MRCGPLSHKASHKQIMKCDLLPDKLYAETGRAVLSLHPFLSHFLTLSLFFSLQLFPSSIIITVVWDSAAAALHAVCCSNHLVPQLQQKEARPLWKSLSLSRFFFLLFPPEASSFGISLQALLSFCLSNILPLPSCVTLKQDQSQMLWTFAWLEITPRSLSPGRT